MIPEPITREEKFLKEIYDAASGGGSDEPVVVALTPNGETSFTADKTAGEIADYLAAGKMVWLTVTMSIDGVTGTGYGLISSEIDLGGGYRSYRAEFTDVEKLKRYVWFCYIGDGAESTTWGLSIYPLVTMIVNLTATSASSAVADKTNGEIYDWIYNGGSAKIRLAMGDNTYTADISTAVYSADDPATTNLIVLMPNTVSGAFFIVQTGDAADDNTDWSLQVVPFPS